MKSPRWTVACGVLALSCSPEPENRTPPGEPTSPTTVPISGGTLAAGMARGRMVAVAADSERDLISVVDVLDAKVTGQLQLAAGEEPGRVIVASDVAHVVLRRGGAVLSVDLPSGTILERRAVCAAPRGIDIDTKSGRLFVVCQTGELVTLPLAGEEGRDVRVLEPDLRDVIFQDNQLLITTFRHAKRITVPLGDASAEPMSQESSGSVNWRTVRMSRKGWFARVHQVAHTDQVSTGNHGYGSKPCGGAIVRTGVRIQDNAAVVQAISLDDAVLPVDIAVHPSDSELAVVAAGARPDQGSIIRIQKKDEKWQPPPCGSATSYPGRMVAATYAPSGELLVQSREPAVLHIGATAVQLSGKSIHQPGSDLFHTDVGTGIACASCHPEGQEDGQTWKFMTPKGSQTRRTLPLGGGLLQAQPFHWSADLPTMNELLGEVMVKRMGGETPSRQQQLHMALWLDGLPAATPLARDAAAVARGREVFERESVGCASCHSGARLSNNQLADVGTSEPLKVPSLRGLGARAPYMHDGCAKTMKERFSVPTNGVNGCGGGEMHGHTAHLSQGEREDLITYLESL